MTKTRPSPKLISNIFIFVLTRHYIDLYHSVKFPFQVKKLKKHETKPKVP